MAEIRTLGNKYPCCQKLSGIHHDHWEDDAVLDKSCPQCGTRWIITFENVRLKWSDKMYRKLNWKKATLDRDEEVWTGSIPTKHLSEYVDEMIEGTVGQVMEIVAWIDGMDPDEFVVDDRYTVAQAGPDHILSATGIVQDGTVIGSYPNLFEGGPRNFIRLLWLVDRIDSTPDLKII
jgi:hypothetical protein